MNGLLAYQAPERPAASVCSLRLYVAGQTPRSLAAIAHLKRLSENYLGSSCEVEVIDLLEHPQLAADDRVIVIPTLVRRRPAPERRVVGDLSDVGEILERLELLPRDTP